MYYLHLVKNKEMKFILKNLINDIFKFLYKAFLDNKGGDYLLEIILNLDNETFLKFYAIC